MLQNLFIHLLPLQAVIGTFAIKLFPFRPRRSLFFMLNKQGSDPLPCSRRAVRGKVPLAMEFKLSFCLGALEGNLSLY